jgi:hypothetical protein
VFENRVLRWMFGPKRVEVTGEWRELHDEELRDLYSSPSTFDYNNQVKEDEVGGEGNTRGENRIAYKLSPYSRILSDFLLLLVGYCKQSCPAWTSAALTARSQRIFSPPLAFHEHQALTYS